MAGGQKKKGKKPGGQPAKGGENTAASSLPTDAIAGDGSTVPTRAEGTSVSDAFSDASSVGHASDVATSDVTNGSDSVSAASITATDGGSTTWSRDTEVGNDDLGGVGKSVKNSLEEKYGKYGLIEGNGNEAYLENGEGVVTPELVELRAELSAQKVRCSELAARCEELTSVNRKLEEEKVSMKDEADKRSKEVQDLLHEKEIIKTDAETFSNDLTSMKTLILEFSSTTESQLKEIQNWKEKTSIAESRAEDAEKRLQSAEEKEKEVRERFETLAEEKEEEVKCRKDAEKLAMEAQEKLAGKVAELTQLENHLGELRVEQESWMDEKKYLQESSWQAVARANAAEERMRIAGDRSQADEEAGAKVRELESENEKVKKENEELRVWKRSAEKKATDEFEAKMALERMKVAAEREAAAAIEKEKSLEKELDRMKSKIQELETEVQKLGDVGNSSEGASQRTGDLETQTRELESTAENSKRLYEDMRREKATVDQELRRAIEKYEQVEADAEQQTKGLKAKVSSMEKENSNLTSQVQKQEADMARLLHQLGAISQELKAVDEERVKFRELNDQLKARHRGMDSSLMSATADAELLRMEHQALKQQFHANWSRWTAAAAVATGAIAVVGLVGRMQARRLGGS